MTIRNKHVKRVKAMFAAAVTKRILASPPAKSLKEEKGETAIDRTRQVMVTPMPIFPETLKHLQDARGTADAGDKVIRWKGSPESVTELLRKRVAAAIGACWPRPCQQLRSTRRTELDAEFPLHVANDWLGHDTATAEKHYQQVTPEHLHRAAMMRTVDERPIRTASCTAEPHSTE